MSDGDRDRQQPVRGDPSPLDESQAPASDEELRQARALAASLEAADWAADGVAVATTGQPAEEIGDAAVLAAAAMIRASAREQSLPAGRREALVDEALAQVLDRAAAGDPGAPCVTGPALNGLPGRFNLRRAAPLLALAAGVLLVVGAVLAGLPLAQRHADLPARGVLPAALSVRALSRPSNDLVGRPITDRAAASQRLDRLFADRLAGYRLRVLASAGR